MSEGKSQSGTGLLEGCNAFQKSCNAFCNARILSLTGFYPSCYIVTTVTENIDIREEGNVHVDTFQRRGKGVGIYICVLEKSCNTVTPLRSVPAQGVTPYNWL
jgi:hypothetical protein